MLGRRSGPREAPLPKRPYRDSALLNGALAIVLVVVSWATGGDLTRAFVVGAVFFAVATAWSWWRFRARLAEQARGSDGTGT